MKVAESNIAIMEASLLNGFNRLLRKQCLLKSLLEFSLNATKDDVEDFFLVAKQFVSNGTGGSEVQKFRVSYKESKCGVTHFTNLRGNQRFISKRNPHPLGHTFEVKFSDLMGTWNSKSKMKLHVEVVLKDGTIVTSKPREVRVLVSPNIVAGVDTMADAVDMYGSTQDGFARTGGDKWFLPGYAGLLETIISHDDDWKYNDLSKLNGGFFPPHSSHKSGRDADIDYAGFDLELLEDNANDWKDPLDKIEKLLTDNEHMWPKIKSILISIPPESVTVKKNRFLLSRFQGRCLGESDKKRYIDFDTPTGYYTLLRKWSNHFDHLHIGFNEESLSGEPKLLSLAPPINTDIDDLRFSFNSNGELEARPSTGVNLNGIRVFWRYQAAEGFNSPNATTHYGRWADGEISVKVLGTQTSGPQRYLYVTFANTSTGGCVMHKIDLDTDAKLRSLTRNHSKTGE